MSDILILITGDFKSAVIPHNGECFLMKFDLTLSNLITKSARVVTQHYQRELLQYGISPSQGGIVYILSIAGSSTQVKIAELLHLDKTNVNAMVKKLEKSGLITLEKDKNDARKSIINLTENGRSLAEKLKQADKAVSETYRKLTGNAKNEEIIRKFLEKIVFGI